MQPFHRTTAREILRLAILAPCAAPATAQGCDTIAVTQSHDAGSACLRITFV